MDDNDIYWFGTYLQLMVMITLLVNIWLTKDCSGISLKSQFMYALVFTTRHQDFADPYISLENIVIKVAYIIVTYGTVLSIVLYFRKSYEKQYDTGRIGILIALCFVIGLFLNDRFDCLEIFTAFSFYLEAVAMIPQMQFVIKTKYIHRGVILYIAAMAAYAVLYIAFLCHQYRVRPYRNYFRVCAGVVQLLLYYNFFMTIYPLLCPQDDSNCEEVIVTVDAIVANDIPKTSQFDHNVREVVLTTSSLVSNNNDKTNLLSAEEANKKY